jgi:hypothetical protein
MVNGMVFDIIEILFKIVMIKYINGMKKGVIASAQFLEKIFCFLSFISIKFILPFLIDNVQV